MSKSADIYISNRLTVPKGFYEYCKSKFSKIILVDTENNEIDTSPDRKSNNKEIYKLRKIQTFAGFIKEGIFSYCCLHLKELNIILTTLIDL